MTSFLGISWIAFVLAWLAGWREGWLGAGSWQIPADEAAHLVYIPGHLTFALSGLLAYGILRRRRWAPPLMVLVWFAFGAATARYTPANATKSIIGAALGALITLLFLTSPRTQAYFRSEERAHT